MHSVSFTNEQTGNGVARVITTHNVSVLVQSHKTIQDVQSSIEKLHTVLSSDPPFTPTLAQHLIGTHGKWLDISLLSHKDQTLTLATGGSGIIFLKREGALTELVGDGNAAQGPPERGDEYILTTSEFLDLIGGLEGLAYYFLHYTSVEVVEMMKTYEDQSVACGFVAIQYGTKHENTTITQPPPIPPQLLPDSIQEVVAQDKPIASKERVHANIIDVLKSRVRSVKKANIHTPLILIFIGLLSYFAYQSVGGVVDVRSGKAGEFRLIQDKVASKLKEADTEAFVNISNAESTFDDARNILSDVSPSDKKKYANEITEIMSQINTKEKKVMRISDTEPKDYFDLHMIDKTASASDIDYADGSFYILDSAKGKIYIVDSARRSHQTLSSDKYKGATHLTSTGNYVYVLTAKDGIYLAEKDRSLQVVKPDTRWGTVTDIKAYTGNIYLLDSKGKNILKYQGVDETVFGDLSQYLVVELQGSISANRSLAIDGSVYASGRESIMKFTTGRKVDFKLTVPRHQIDIASIYTDPDLDALYMYDTKNQALYSMNKEGIFDKQWIIKQPVIAVAASDKGSKVFAATSQYIYEIENK